MNDMSQTDEARLYNALADAGDSGLPLASLARLVGARRAGELLTAMGKRFDVTRDGNRLYLRDT